MHLNLIEFQITDHLSSEFLLLLCGSPFKINDYAKIFQYLSSHTITVTCFIIYALQASYCLGNFDYSFVTYWFTYYAQYLWDICPFCCGICYVIVGFLQGTMDEVVMLWYAVLSRWVIFVVIVRSCDTALWRFTFYVLQNK